MKLIDLFHRLLSSCGGEDGKAQLIPSGRASDVTDSDSEFKVKRTDSNDSDASDVADEAAEYWWNTTAPTLQTMLSNAGYSAQQEQRILGFYQKYIVRSLGPQPTADGKFGNWRSFMTDDFTPMEFSWNWGSTSAIKQPTIRFSVEAIDRLAGLSQDPWNMNATTRYMQMFERDLPGCDCSIFRKLTPRMAEMRRKATAPQISNTDLASPSSLFMAFDLDLNKPHPTVKAYMLPFTHSTSPSKSRGEIVRDFLLPFAKEEQWESLIELLDFGVTSNAQFGIQPFMIAFDCVPTQENRMKIYFRSTDTSFAAVTRVLGAHCDGKVEESALADLRTLWHGIFGVDPSLDPAAPLPSKDHETAGILFYYEVRPNCAKVTAKVYLPAKHYGINDEKTMRALASFFGSKQREQQRLHDQPCWADRYVSTVEDMCRHRPLNAGLGLHSYITCAFKNGGLDCTSYLNPEIYHGGRRARTEPPTSSL